MKTKRLNRDGWGFQYFPYYQMRIDCADFHGMACVILLLDGKEQNWDTPRAGKVRVCGEGMMWMTLLPDSANHIITAMYYPDNGLPALRSRYPAFASRRYPVSVWYVDVTEGYSYDPDGVIRYTDKYLDYIFTPEGDISISDRDELDAAYKSGELSAEQYENALTEGGIIEKLYCKNIRATEKRFTRIREYVEAELAKGIKPMFLYHGSRYKLDVIKPQQAQGETEGESQNAVYASWALRDVFPFALPIMGYPGEEDIRSFACDKGKTKIIRGIIDPDAKGYIYRVSPKSFTKLDGWQWTSSEEVTPIETLEVRVGDHFDTVTWSDEAWRMQQKLYNTRR